MLKFSKANAKTKALAQIDELQSYLEGGRKVYSLDLLSGYSCPAAKLCRSMATVDQNGKRTITDGPHTQFRCFSASQEALYTATYNSRKHNFDALRTQLKMQDKLALLQASLPANLGILRFHVAGDFFCPSYFEAALKLAEQNSHILFYTYTKSTPYISGHNAINLHSGIMRDNFLLTGSLGGLHDELTTVVMRTVQVIFTEDESQGLPIDHDDSHAATPGGNFCLLIHGTQPKGSEAAKAKSALKGKGSYARR